MLVIINFIMTVQLKLSYIIISCGCSETYFYSDKTYAIIKSCQTDNYNTVKLHTCNDVLVINTQKIFLFYFCFIFYFLFLLLFFFLIFFFWPGNITKTCLYNADHFKPHFYIVKLGFTVVYIIFLRSAQIK